MEIIHPRKPNEIAAAKVLFVAYAESLDYDLCFQDFDEEMARFPGEYVPPKGTLLLALDGGTAAGAVGLRPLREGVCEMKRLYVRPEFRGTGLGRDLAERIIGEGRRLRYRAMRLDTLPNMTTAKALYRDLGFREISPYTYNPIEDVLFLERDLAPVEGT